MAEGSEAADKPHEATPERLRKARQKGDVTQSPEVQTLARYLGLLLVLAGAGGALALGAAGRLSGFLVRPEAAGAYLLGGGDTLALLAPIALPVLVALGCAGGAVLGAVTVLRAVTFTPSKLKPDPKRLSPVSNAGQKFGPKGMKEFLRTTIKTLAVAAAATALAVGVTPRLMARTGASPGVLGEELGMLLLAMLGVAVGISFLAAAADLPARHFARLAKLRMSHQELTDENKDSEGDPERKKARRKRAQELAQGAGLNDVPKADVVVVNPEHYAVALSWDREAGEVPRCVAKGTDHLALAIKRRAAQAGVPVHRDVRTARALHATVEVGEPIRREHFAAVAAAIRFADRVTGRAAKR